MTSRTDTPAGDTEAREAIVDVLMHGLDCGLSNPINALGKNVAECFADAILALPFVIAIREQAK